MVSGRIGIVTGSGPEAGIDLWTKVLGENRRVLGDSFSGDVDTPDVTIVSVPELGHSMDLPETADVVWSHLRAACERLADQVDVYAIACNTLYWFEPDLRALDLPARLVSPVDCLRREAEGRPDESFALLGAAPVTDFAAGGSPYARLDGVVALELHDDPMSVHELIGQIKLAGGSRPELESRFAALLAELDSDVAVLACTELPLLSGAGAAIELLDVTQMMAAELVRTATAGSGGDRTVVDGPDVDGAS